MDLCLISYFWLNMDSISIPQSEWSLAEMDLRGRTSQGDVFRYILESLVCLEFNISDQTSGQKASFLCISGSASPCCRKTDVRGHPEQPVANTGCGRSCWVCGCETPRCLVSSSENEDNHESHLAKSVRDN